MDPNNRNNRNRGDKNRRRGGGMWSIVLWALLLTIGVNYLSVMLDQARTAESSCEIAYSELVELVEEGKVKSIEFGDMVFTTVIPRNIRLAEAPSHGVPVTVYDRGSRGAVAYRAMAEEIKAKLE